jgi:hypothetical protein
MANSHQTKLNYELLAKKLSKYKSRKAAPRFKQAVFSTKTNDYQVVAEEIIYKTKEANHG